MKACPERALLLQGLQEEEDGAFEGLKQEEEVEDENGPFVVVKLEEEQAACSARSSGSSSASSAAAEAKMELELSLFAPVESDEEEQQRLQQRSLTDSECDSAGAPVWRNRGARERAGQTEAAEFPQKRPRGRPRRQKKALGRRGRPRKVAAGSESRDGYEWSSSVERPCVPVQSGPAEGLAGASAPYAVPHLTSAVSPLAGLEPPLLPAAPGLQERAQGGERQENVLLEVLSHCRFLHAAVQRLEQKIDNLQSNRYVTGGCSKQEIPEEGQLPAGQLSWSLAQRLGPSPQTRDRRAPPWKRHPAQPIPGTTFPPEPDPYGSRATRTHGGGRGNGRRRGRWGAGAKRGSQPQQPSSELQPEQELPKEGSFAIKEEAQAAEVPKKVPRLNRRVKKRSGAVGKLKDAVPIKQEDTPRAEEDKQAMIGSAMRKVWIPVSVYMEAFKEAEPQKAMVPVLHALFPISTLSCSAVTGDPLRGVQQLDPNKLEALREWLAEMYPQRDLTVRGSAWAQCLGVLNRITKDLRKKEGTSPRVEAE